jgi:hypothetical protein
MLVKILGVFIGLILSVNARATVYNCLPTEGFAAEYKQHKALGVKLAAYEGVRVKLRSNNSIEQILSSEHVQENFDKDTYVLAREIMNEIKVVNERLGFDTDPEYTRVDNDIKAVEDSSDKQAKVKEIVKLQQGDLQKMNHLRQDLMKELNSECGAE